MSNNLNIIKQAGTYFDPLKVIPKLSVNFDDIYSKFYPQREVKNITFVVTQECQLRCTYCYEVKKNSKNEMTFEIAKKAVDKIFEYNNENNDNGPDEAFEFKKTKCIVFDFIGGEPLLRIDLIDKILEYFLLQAVKHESEFKIHWMAAISSNGIAYFNPEVQNFLKKWNGRVSLSITIDGNKALHDSCRVFKDGKPSYDLVEKAVKHALENGYMRGTKVTISPFNLPYLSDALINLLKYERLVELPANPVFEVEWSEKQGARYYKELKKLADYIIENKTYKRTNVTLFSNSIGDNIKVGIDETDDINFCGGTGKMFSLNANGDVYPCIRYMPFTLTKENDKYNLGNINNDIILKDKEKQKIFDKLLNITKSSQSLKECLDCPVEQGCAWCSGWNFDYYGTPNKRFIGICNMHKARTLANTYYWNKLVLTEPNLYGCQKINLPDEDALKYIDKKELDMLKDLEKKAREKFENIG